MATPQYERLPSGFAARCDWVLGSRQSHYGKVHKLSAWGDTHAVPSTVFVRTDLLQPFYHHILPCIVKPIVLVTGDSDQTLPRQVDKRHPKKLARSVWDAILADDRIVRIFSENLDETAPKVTPIPLGINPKEFPGRNADFILDRIVGPVNINDRPLRVLQLDRIRTGPQWMDRAAVRALCERGWAPFCDSGIKMTGGIINGGGGATAAVRAGDSFLQLVAQYPFVLCVHGGGLDPSPKAWEALAVGTVPIIQHFPGDAAYRGLPVVLVDTWDVHTITQKKLAEWRSALAPLYSDPAARAEVVRRLHADYWWGKVQAALRGASAGAVGGRRSSDGSGGSGRGGSSDDGGCGRIEADLAIEWRPEPPPERALTSTRTRYYRL